jgi:hypothetical protein
MLINSDLYYLGPGWGQQPFPTKAIIIPLLMYRLEEHKTKALI